MRFREANEIIGRIRTPQDGYDALRASVIAIACDDWNRAYELGDTMRMNSIEKFFLSDRYLLFSDGIDGAYILRKLKENAAKTKPKRARERKAVRKYDKHGNLLAEYSSVSDAAWDTHGDQRSISRACKSGDECYGYYWEFA